MPPTIHLPGKPTVRKINLVTRKNNQIDNEQSFEFSSFEKNQMDQLRTNYPEAKIRCEPSPIYNCHGMTFAARRTGIFESAEITRILQEDGYTEVPKESVMAGDIIIYRDQSGDYEHSGIVVHVPTRSENLLRIPVVCSKWGRGHEFVHQANYCPYNYANVKYYRVTIISLS
jgi:hypothetical protein